ncbi:hypothetical protein R3P38DRAFT_2812061 [Favolaschia claudopus]|uniref:Uncharacterized protein n=1 Tax=Favolaschia claudopus TaxID=2862362 RepID=A0AAV9Z7Q1_9AGAR
MRSERRGLRERIDPRRAAAGALYWLRKKINVSDVEAMIRKTKSEEAEERQRDRLKQEQSGITLSAERTSTLEPLVVLRAPGKCQRAQRPRTQYRKRTRHGKKDDAVVTVDSKRFVIVGTTRLEWWWEIREVGMKGRREEGTDESKRRKGDVGRVEGKRTGEKHRDMNAPYEIGYPVSTLLTLETPYLLQSPCPEHSGPSSLPWIFQITPSPVARAVKGYVAFECFELLPTDPSSAIRNIRAKAAQPKPSKVWLGYSIGLRDSHKSDTLKARTQSMVTGEGKVGSDHLPKPE